MAASMDLVELIHYLTLRGADYEFKMGMFEKTALHIAVEHGNELATKLLLNNGADITQKDYFGFDVYNKAEYRGNYHFFPILDYFKNKKRERKVIDYEEKRYCGPFKVEELDTGLMKFRPSQMLEYHYNKNADTSNKINPDQFMFYIFDEIPFHPHSRRNNYHLGGNFGDVIRIKYNDPWFVQDIQY